MRGGCAGLGQAHPEPLVTLPWMGWGAQVGSRLLGGSRCRGRAWPPLWETWGKKRKAPSLGGGADPTVVPARSARSPCPPLGVEPAGSPSPRTRPGLALPSPTTLGGPSPSARPSRTLPGPAAGGGAALTAHGGRSRAPGSGLALGRHSHSAPGALTRRPAAGPYNPEPSARGGPGAGPGWGRGGVASSPCSPLAFGCRDNGGTGSPGIEEGGEGPLQAPVPSGKRVVGIGSWRGAGGWGLGREGRQK